LIWLGVESISIGLIPSGVSILQLKLRVSISFCKFIPFFPTIAPHAGWLLTAVMGVLLMAVVAWISVEKAKQPALVGHGLHGKGLGNVREVGFALMETSALMSGLVLYALTLYSLAWLVVPLVAMAQGKGWGAILFFLGSPLMIVMSGIFGWGIGMILSGQVTG
jgi:hypothetical protein